MASVIIGLIADADAMDEDETRQLLLVLNYGEAVVFKAVVFKAVVFKAVVFKAVVLKAVVFKVVNVNWWRSLTD